MEFNGKDRHDHVAALLPQMRLLADGHCVYTLALIH